ncbi:hypothetical protein OG294_15340 [Kitasatospora sp. NBC_01302]|nr:hypothetical protein OG294_15340 [Kitasatospora sp. NBC_01302]
MRTDETGPAGDQDPHAAFSIRSVSGAARAGARTGEGATAPAGYGGIFQRNIRASGMIPQISVMLGQRADAPVLRVERGLVDDVIDPAETRAVLAHALAMLRTKHADQSDEELAALTAVLLTRAAANAAAAAPPARPMLRPAPHLAYRSPVSWLQAA